MKITELEIIEIEASHRGNWIFVRLHTDAGLSGLGEASQSGNDGLVQAAHYGAWLGCSGLLAWLILWR